MPHAPTLPFIIGCYPSLFSHLQVWHNYGYDRHVLSNMGIECEGFGADTLHMARLLDASRRGRKTYALDNLTDPVEGYEVSGNMGAGSSVLQGVCLLHHSFL